MAHKEQGYRFRIDYDFDHRKKVIEGLDHIIVIPVNTEIEKDQTVLNLDNVKKIVDASKTIAVMDCSCRKELKRCDAPVETCMTFDENAEEMLASDDTRIRSYRPHPVSHDDAMEVLRGAAEAGLVHLAYVGKDSKDGKIGTICSCCSCCCENLGSILRFGMAPHLLKASAYTSTDESRCTGCGACEDRCHFGARKIKDGALTFDKSRCYGCGLCVGTCPTSAISIIQQHQ